MPAPPDLVPESVRAVLAHALIRRGDTAESELPGDGLASFDNAPPAGDQDPCSAGSEMRAAALQASLFALPSIGRGI